MTHVPDRSLVITQLLRFPSVGSGSLRMTFFAVPSPSLVVTIEKVTLSPRLKVPLSGVFTTVTWGGRQPVSPVSVTGWRPVLVTVAVLLSRCGGFGHADVSAPPGVFVVTVTVRV